MNKGVLKNRRSKAPKKMILLFILVICLLVTTFYGLSTYAVFIDSNQKENHFEVGELKVSILSKATIPMEIKAGEVYPKEVGANNVGQVQSFIRIMAMPSLVARDQTVLNARLNKEVFLDINTSEWIDGKDGYFYYLGLLEPKQQKILFTQVSLSNPLPTEYTGAKLTISVKTEAITSAKGVYRDAWWGGKTPNTGVLKQIDDVLSPLSKSEDI